MVYCDFSVLLRDSSESDRYKSCFRMSREDEVEGPGFKSAAAIIRNLGLVFLCQFIFRVASSGRDHFFTGLDWTLGGCSIFEKSSVAFSGCLAFIWFTALYFHVKEAGQCLHS